jgi:hypothetical protein
MPARRRDFNFPAWVDALGDACLIETTKEALIARETAKRAGALENKRCREIFRSADATLDQIEFGRARDARACAATAVRKFTAAAGCRRPGALGRAAR